jgi:hypothetical protein
MKKKIRRAILRVFNGQGPQQFECFEARWRLMRSHFLEDQKYNSFVVQCVDPFGEETYQKIFVENNQPPTTDEVIGTVREMQAKMVIDS